MPRDPCHDLRPACSPSGDQHVDRHRLRYGINRHVKPSSQLLHRPWTQGVRTSGFSRQLPPLPQSEDRLPTAPAERSAIEFLLAPSNLQPPSSLWGRSCRIARAFVGHRSFEPYTPMPPEVYSRSVIADGSPKVVPRHRCRCCWSSTGRHARQGLFALVGSDLAQATGLRLGELRGLHTGIE